MRATRTAHQPRRERLEEWIFQDATRDEAIFQTAEGGAPLLARAGRGPLGTFIRNMFRNGNARAMRWRSLCPIEDHEALARVPALPEASLTAGRFSFPRKASWFMPLKIHRKTFERSSMTPYIVGT